MIFVDSKFTKLRHHPFPGKDAGEVLVYDYYYPDKNWYTLTIFLQQKIDFDKH